VGFGGLRWGIGVVKVLGSYLIHLYIHNVIYHVYVYMYIYTCSRMDQSELTFAGCAPPALKEEFGRPEIKDKMDTASCLQAPDTSRIIYNMANQRIPLPTGTLPGCYWEKVTGKPIGTCIPQEMHFVLLKLIIDKFEKLAPFLFNMF
jgi:hypothetical protein